MDKFNRIKKVFHQLDIETPFSVVGGYLRDGKGLFRGDNHYAPQMVIVLSGQQEVYYQDYHDNFEAGQVWWTSCWEPHVNRVTGNYFSYVAVTISLDVIGSFAPFHEIDWLMPFFCPPSERPKPTERKLRCEILQLGRKILRLEKHKPHGYQTMQWLKIHEIILKNILLLNHNSDADHRAKHFGIIQILPAIQLVKSKQNQVISLEEAAAECSLSKSRFSELFTKTMNVSFSNFALQVRISTAAHMLRNSSLSVIEIADYCGFLDISHFYHVFTKNFKCTPKEFAEQKY